ERARSVEVRPQGEERGGRDERRQRSLLSGPEQPDQRGEENVPLELRTVAVRGAREHDRRQRREERHERTARTLRERRAEDEHYEQGDRERAERDHAVPRRRGGGERDE